MDLLQLLQENLNRTHRQLMDQAAERTFNAAAAQESCEMVREQISLMTRYIFPALRSISIAEGTLRNMEGDQRLMHELASAIIRKQTEDPRGALVQLHLVFSRHADALERFLFPLIRSNLTSQQQAEMASKIQRQPHTEAEPT